MFKKVFQSEANKTLTENGDLAYKSTGTSVIDMFGKIGSMRGGLSSDDEIKQKAIELFINAYDENPELAVKTLFYTRDCRGGMGEKMVFKAVALHLLNDDNKKKLILNNLNKIVEYGSWKDIIDLILQTTSEENKKIISKFMYQTMLIDMYNILENKPISLLGKWLPTINSKSNVTKDKAKKILSIIKKFHDPTIGYRNYCTVTRQYLNITEKNIAQKEYEKIDYSKVTSRCMLLYRNTFKHKDNERFEKFMNDVENGKAKINSSVLFPSDIVHKYESGYWNQIERLDNVLEEQWKALPNYMDKPINMIPIADTSGSMCGTPMNVSKGLSIYLAERNPCEAFNNLIIEFGRDAHLYDISKKTSLMSKLNGFNEDCGNTNLKKAFEKILQIGKDNNLSNDDMPKVLLIISDMQFDQATYGDNDGTIRVCRQLFNEAGYELPNIIFWNVNARDSFPELDRDGVAFVSGYSPAIMKAVLNAEVMAPLEVVMKAVLVDRYKDVFWNLNE